MSFDPQRIRTALTAAFPSATVEVVDTVGDGNHFQVTVISDLFTGRSLIERHRMIYAPLQDDLRTGALHALAIRAYTSTEIPSAGEGAMHR